MVRSYGLILLLFLQSVAGGRIPETSATNEAGENGKPQQQNTNITQDTTESVLNKRPNTDDIEGRQKKFIKNIITINEDIDDLNFLFEMQNEPRKAGRSTTLNPEARDHNPNQNIQAEAENTSKENLSENIADQTQHSNEKLGLTNTHSTEFIPNEHLNYIEDTSNSKTIHASMTDEGMTTSSPTRIQIPIADITTPQLSTIQTNEIPDPNIIEKSFTESINQKEQTTPIPNFTQAPFASETLTKETSNQPFSLSQTEQAFTYDPSTTQATFVDMSQTEQAINGSPSTTPIPTKEIANQESSLSQIKHANSNHLSILRQDYSPRNMIQAPVRPYGRSDTVSGAETNGDDDKENHFNFRVVRRTNPGNADEEWIDNPNYQVDRTNLDEGQWKPTERQTRPGHIYLGSVNTFKDEENFYRGSYFNLDKPYIQLLKKLFRRSFY